jgi:predicted nuclease of restriction endonuclease-like (RecB) superfamily
MNELEPLLIRDLRALIEEAKTRVARTVNQEMTLLYWRIGQRIQQDILKFERAEYGKELVENLSKTLNADYGQGFSRRNLFYMIQFFNCFQSFEIVQTLSAQLSWSHYRELISVSDAYAREFYAYMCLKGQWSVRNLRSQISRMLFECTKASQKDEKTLKHDLAVLKSDPLLIPDLVLKDPYILEFLGLPPEHYESELEEAILKDIEKFILELGTGFSFIERQKRMTVDEEHYYLDLLFYNRKLKRLVAVELKTGKFKPEYLGQMAFYLGWLKRFEIIEGENPPIGIILCTEKSAHQIELLDLNGQGIHVAEYWTDLPPRDVFEKKVRDIVTRAKDRFESTSLLDHVDEKDFG